MPNFGKLTELTPDRLPPDSAAKGAADKIPDISAYQRPMVSFDHSRVVRVVSKIKRVCQEPMEGAQADRLAGVALQSLGSDSDQHL